MNIDSEANSDEDEIATKFSCYHCRKGYYIRECTRLALARKHLRQYDQKKEQKRAAIKPKNKLNPLSNKSEKDGIEKF